METLLRKSVVYDKYIFKDYFDGSSEDQNATGVVKTVLMRLGSKNTTRIELDVTHMIFKLVMLISGDLV